MALERPPCHRIQGEINSGAFFRGERFGFSIPADDCVNDNLHPFSDLRTVRIEQEFHEQFLPCGKHGKAPRTLMLAASQRRFDILLFCKLDRLSREGVRKNSGLP